MKLRQLLPLVATLMFACLATASAQTAAAQSAGRPQRTGIPTGNGPAQGEELEVEIIPSSIGRRPFSTYRLPSWKGQFVLDTASASPVSESKGGSQGAPIRLEPQTTYCFCVGSSVGDRTDFYRKGIFTTLPKR